MLRNKEQEKQIKNFHNNEIREINPLKLLTNERLDIAIRIIVLRKFANNSIDMFHRNLYAKLLLFRNGAYESKNTYTPETKQNIEEYLNSALTAYSNIKKNGFDKNVYIPINRYGQILDGSHRIASSIILGKSLYIKECKTKRIEQFSFSWFKEHGFNSIELLVTLNEYAINVGARLEISISNKRSLNNKDLIGWTDIYASRQCIEILEEEEIPINLMNEVEGTIRLKYWKKEKKHLFCKINNTALYSKTIYNSLNINSIFIFNNFKLDKNVIREIKKLSTKISPNTKEHMILFGEYCINILMGYKSNAPRIIIIDDEKIKEEIIDVFGNDIEIRLIDNVKRLEESLITFFLYDIQIIAPYMTNKELNNMLPEDNEIIGNIREYVKQKCSNYKQVMHLANEKDYLYLTIGEIIK